MIVDYLQLMVLQGVHPVHLTSIFPIVDENMSQVTCNQSIMNLHYNRYGLLIGVYHVGMAAISEKS